MKVQRIPSTSGLKQRADLNSVGILSQPRYASHPANSYLLNLVQGPGDWDTCLLGALGLSRDGVKFAEDKDVIGVRRWRHR